MISSRCKDSIRYQDREQSLEVLRRVLKSELERIEIGGKQVFKVWIHEDESNASAIMNNWEACINKSRNADVFIALYNGRSGWLGSDSPVKDGVGICHAELSAAFDKSPAKVRSIQFKELVVAKAGSPDEKFQKYFSARKIPGAQVKTGEEALERTKELAAAVVLSLAREGVGVNSTGSYYAGEALEWSRMKFQRRREAMTAAVVTLLRRRHDRTGNQPADNVAAVEIRGLRIGFVCDSIPAAMSCCRPRVGRPAFLNDFRHTETWDAATYGPVQDCLPERRLETVRQLGFGRRRRLRPVRRLCGGRRAEIQMAFIANCRDETTTETQAFLNWLNDHVGQIPCATRERSPANWRLIRKLADSRLSRSRRRETPDDCARALRQPSNSEA
jgi:hypothetical protein